MASRRIVSLVTFALGALLIHPNSPNVFVVVDAQINDDPPPQFPSGSIDVGGLNTNPPAVPGTHSGSGDAWSVSGSAGDIWGNYDRFHYLYANRTGDVTVTCRVKNFTNNNNSWRKGGIMLRSNLGPQSKNSMIVVTGWGIAHQSRRTEAGSAESQHDGFQLANVWLRLVKRGNTVTSYVRREGEYGYTRYHSVDVDLGDRYHVGLAVTMQDPLRLGTLEVANFEISDAAYSFPGVPAKIGTTSNGFDNQIKVQEVGEGLWSINTGGAGIGGTSDSFGLVYEELTGDVNATLHLEKMARRTKFTRGGLMIRSGNASDAAHVSILIDPDRGVTMYHRANAGGSTGGKNLGVMTEDVVMRLEKTGDAVRCLYRQIGAAGWIELGTASATFGDTFLVGRAVASGELGAHAQVTTGALIVERPGAGSSVRQ